MNRTLPAILVATSALLILALCSLASAETPSAKGGSEVDSLIDRIKSARAHDEAAYGSSDTNQLEPKPKDRAVKAKETVPSEPKDRNAEKVREQRAAEIEKMTKDPHQYVNDSLTQSHAGGAASSYGTSLSVSELMDRIRAGRSEESAKEKAEKERVAPEGTGTEPRTPSTDVSAFRRFLTPASRADVSGTVGGETMLEKQMTPTGAAEVRGTAKGAELPDPTKDASAYEARVRQDLGARGELPGYADKNLLGVYETNRFGRWLSQSRDVTLDSGRVDASQAYRTFQNFQKMPDTGSSVAPRDVYVPNSTSFINSTYRGSIYDIPYSTDPFGRNYSDLTTQSKYSSASYYNLGTRESYQDYYTREYGVSRAFVPGTASSQNFEVNTVKQWTENLRNTYGVNVRPGDATYGDLYRLQTGLRKH